MLPDVVVRFVAEELRIKSVKEPGLALAPGTLVKLQLAVVFRLGLLPLKILGGAMPIAIVRVSSELVPDGFSAVRPTIVPPSGVTAVGMPLINPVVVFNVNPAGRVPDEMA